MERDPRYCHRRLISRHLEKLGVRMVHILEEGSGLTFVFLGECLLTEPSDPPLKWSFFSKALNEVFRLKEVKMTEDSGVTDIEFYANLPDGFLSLL